MDKCLDQRILNTKQDLYSALFDLLKTSTSIKVLDICKKANITPMTFYHHYRDKAELMKEAVKDQLALRLPIPVKLKPKNMRQFVYYLFRFLSEFSLNNKDLLNTNIRSTISKVFKNSYLDILVKTIRFYISKELSQLFSSHQQITFNIWTDIISYGFIGLFWSRVINNKNIDFETIKNNFNLFINNYCTLN